MTTTERLAQTNLFANKSFYNALDRQSLPSSNAIATPMGFNPETGQLRVVVGDGIAKTNNLGANVLGITGAIANGIGGNGGYSFGRV
jgi:hypothetical protein